MLYLDEVVIHNFKSFKHTVIKFNKGFSCIVGPNGSGKSNICDSLLFALGETSLKRLRVSSSAQLINKSAKPGEDEGLRRAYVKVKFSGSKDLEVMKTIKSNQKVAYRLNGKRVTRQEIIEVLREYNSNINETNTITQSEIAQLLGLNSRQRRELIDVAAGIKEYNDKRDVSLKELEKVDAKINESKIMLNERLGFLNELEKEKNDAERYNKLSTEIKQMNYTVLKIREKEVESRYEETTEQMNQKSALQQKLDKQISDLDLELTSLLNEKERISKGLSAKSAEAGSANKILEEVNKNIAINSTQLSSSNEGKKSAKERIHTLQGELKKIKAKENENAEAIKKMSFELEVKAKDLPEHGSYDDSEAASLSEQYNVNYKKVEELDSRLSSMSLQHAQFTAEYENLSKTIMEMHKSMNEFGAKRTTLTNDIKSGKDAISSLGKNKAEMEKELVSSQEKLKALQEKLNLIYADNVSLRETLAVVGRESGKGSDVLAKELGKGFHGKAQNICTYDDKYALAAESAAGSRFGYFVVDSIDVASAAIDILKSKKLGRASFIPIKEISAKESKGPASLKPMLDYIKFDAKYAKVFSYIFANTFLVENIKEAQKVGIGSYRFVTLEGDLVEPSGIVSGGSPRSTQSASVLESKIKKLANEDKEVRAKIDEANATLEIVKKKIANYQVEILNYELGLKQSLAQEDDANRNMDSLDQKVTQYESRCKELKEKIAATKSEKERAETAANLLKQENAQLRAAIDGIIAGRAGNAKAKEASHKLTALREEVEKLKISIAETTKENAMIKTRMEELGKEIKDDDTNLSILGDKTGQLEKEIAKLSQQKTELEASLETHGKKASQVLKELQALDEKLAKLGMEKGKSSADRERTSREMIELDGRKTQLQTRLSDIKAELASYPKMEMIEGAKTDELEKRVTISKNDLERLGAVNLKAPEMYELRKKDMEESKARLETLEMEKNSILSMIEQIETKKLGVFSDTLNTVNENFKKIYGYIFDGSASLSLKNPKDPFNSGLDINVELKHKKRNLEELSGGQKSLIMLTLIFAIQMRVPMSFYIFDEIDIALDKENSKVLSKLIKELSQKSQFIVVSHNDSLITAADTAIGVVNKANESQVVGVQITTKQ